VLPQFVFTDIDAAAPRHGETPWLDMHFPERRQILQRLEKWRVEERFDVIVFDDAIVERDAKPMIIQRLNRNDPRRPH
jgi:predicted ATPase